MQLLEISARELESLQTRTLKAAGLTDVQATNVSQHLTESELIGRSSHGAILLPNIVRHILNSRSKPDPTISWSSDAHLHCKSDNHFGYTVLSDIAKRLTQRLSENASVGALATIERISHAGRLGHYVKEIANDGLIGIALAQSNPWVAAPSGKKPVLGSTAMAISFPFSSPPVIVDFTPNIITAGAVRSAALNGEELPVGAAINVEGKATTDPQEVLSGGALLTIAEGKGFSIAFAISILCIIAGGDALALMDRGYGYILACIDPARLGSGDYLTRVADLYDAVLQSGEDVRMPGSRYCVESDSNSMIRLSGSMLEAIQKFSSCDSSEKLLSVIESYSDAFRPK